MKNKQDQVQKSGKVNKKLNWTLFFIAFGLLIVNIGSLFYLYNISLVPDFIKDPVIVNDGFINYRSSTRYIRLYYPCDTYYFDDNILDDIMDDAKNLPLKGTERYLIRGEYNIKKNHDIIKLTYGLKDYEGFQKVYTYYFNARTQSRLDSSIFTDDALRYIANSFRNICKDDASLLDYPYTSEFMELSEYDSGIYNDVSYDDGVFTFDVKTPVVKQFSIDAKEIADDVVINIDVDQERVIGKTIIDDVEYDVDIPYHYVNYDRKFIALTFDDGPSIYTPMIIETLKKYQSRATFFTLGTNVERYPNIILDIINSGSQIGSHSYSHEHLTKIKGEQLDYELNMVHDKVFYDISNYIYEPHIFRVPYGEYDTKLQDYINYPIVLWNVDTLDWETRDVEQIKNTIREQVYSGAIILCHDIYEPTALAIVELIPELIDEGYQLVTIDEYMAIRNISMENGEIYP